MSDDPPPIAAGAEPADAAQARLPRARGDAGAPRRRVESARSARADRDRRHRLPRARRRRRRRRASGALMRDGVDAIGEVPARSLGRRGALRPDPDDAGPDRDARRRVPAATIDGFDAGVLRHLAARGAGHGPAAAAAARSGLGSARDAGQAPDRLEHSATGVFVGVVRQRLRLAAAADAGPRAARRALRLGHRAQHRLGPAVVPARPAGAEPDDRHRLLVVAGGGAPGVPGLRSGECAHGARRRREPDPVARPLHRAVALAHAGARRPLQDLRRRRRRLRARRRLRRGRAQAAVGRAGRRRPHPRGDPRQRGQPGRRRAAA